MNYDDLHTNENWQAKCQTEEEEEEETQQILVCFWFNVT